MASIKIMEEMTDKSKMLGQILSNVFGESQEYIERVFERYREYYNLIYIEQTAEIAPRLFQFYKTGEHFLVLAICNEAGEIFIYRDSSSENYVWRLVGGFLRNGEYIEDGIDRLVSNETHLDIDEIEPLSFVKNNFTCQNKKISHLGLAFLVHTRGNVLVPNNRHGTFATTIPEQLAYTNKQILQLAFDRLNGKRTFRMNDEIDINRSQHLKYLFHKIIVSRIFDAFSSKILRQKVRTYCENADTALDVACGNDTLILEISRTVKFCIANDISWDVLRYLRQHEPRENILFTNHSAIDLPFKTRFDVVICKNVLHHMHNLAEFATLTEGLRGMGKRLILVDVENPSKTTFYARLWNRYYTGFLKDRGQYFLTRNEFEEAVKFIYEGATIKFDNVQTIKGNYMMAIVDIPQ